ncbi:MAG: hypothetical protein GF384_08785 [Elusimicrobia bacterium]|nr:hypothetical protein [Elusimicrobiota bacterium]MBD3412703.1 hypothetical protein [Elusimicrobiota bacterium]
MNTKIVLFVLIITLLGLTSVAVFSVPIKVIDQVINYPNPFDSRTEQTVISYMLDADARVKLEIYDLLGYKVKESSFYPGEPGGRKGVNRIAWNGENENGMKVAKGGYICRIYAEYRDTYACAIRKIGVIH